ncbi:MAG: tetratricopeptide repeat protein [Acidobacteriota bacterium]
MGERRLVDWSGLPVGLTTGFRELLRACLEENRDDRPSNVLEVREVLKRELRACESGSVVTERAVVLPTERDAFVGRASELAALSEWLVGTSRLLTVLGPGGSGKTRLVVHHAWATVEDHPGGTWFCDLSETTSLEEVVTAVAATLEVPLQDAASVEKLGHALRARGRCLVVLDNFEQVAVHAADVLGPWLELAPEARFVVTSRVVLNLSGEQVLTVEPLGHESAVELFELRARSRNPQFVVDDENRADVQELVRLVDGLPLAIELAAARIRILSPQALVERMSDRFALLTTAPGAAGRQATLRATIEWSWSLLASWEKAALAQTSVFVGGFTLADAEAVLDLSAWDDAPWPLDAVQVLVDKSLLRTWESLPGRAGSGERWFGTDASVREFAVEKLCAPEAIASGASGPEAEQAAIQRHGEHFASLGSERRIAALDRHGGWTARQALSPRRDNLVVACRRALERGDAKTSAGAFVAAWAVMELTGPLVTARELGESVLACESLDASERLRVLLVQVEVSRHAGDVEGAWSLCEEALALAVRAGSRHHEMTARRVKGKLLWLRAQASEARACFEEVLGQARELGDPRGEGLALGALATMDADQGRFDDALARSTKSLSIIREVGDRRQEAMGLVGIGILHRFAGRLDEARECLQESLDIRRELGDRAGEGMVIDNLATLHHDRGDHVEALTCFQDVLATHREVGNRPSEALVQVNIGVIASKLGQLEEADAAFAAAESIMREARGAPRLAMLLISRAEHRQRIGDQAGFRADLAEAESLAEQLGVGPESRIGQAITRLREENGE